MTRNHDNDRSAPRRGRRCAIVAGSLLASLTLGATAALGLAMKPDAVASDAPRRDLTTATRAQVETYVAGQGGHVAVALLDRVTGAELTVNGSRPFTTASIVKVDILAALLLQHQAAGTTPTGTQRALATAMITSSDNAATDTLWRQIGGAGGLDTANRRLGLTETKPVPGGRWGLTTTTAADQLRLMRAVTDPAGPLDAAGRDYLFGLMSQVVPAQTWGVPQVRTAQATGVYVKNGWVPLVADGNRWTVNSIGRIVEPGHDWLVVVLSDHHGTQQAGIAMVEHTAGLTVRPLRQA